MENYPLKTDKDSEQSDYHWHCQRFSSRTQHRHREPNGNWNSEKVHFCCITGCRQPDSDFWRGGEQTFSLPGGFSLDVWADRGHGSQPGHLVRFTVSTARMTPALFLTRTPLPGLRRTLLLRLKMFFEENFWKKYCIHMRTPKPMILW